MDKNEIEKVSYINTPFAYTRQQQGLTLLQQNIMTRISAHLQKYFNDYWGNKELRASRETPKTFLTDQQIENLGPIRVELSELGISSSTYERVSEARQAILNIPLNGVVVESGGAVDRAWNIISHVDLPLTDHGTKVMKKERVTDEKGRVHKVGEAKETLTSRYRGYMDIYLNKALIKSMLDVTQGYVSHPENIAQIGNVPNMPLMYYFIRHHMNNFKPLNGTLVNEVKVDLDDLREYLGMIKKNTNGEVVKVKYSTYSQFKAKVLKTALDDIQRICMEGFIDFYFEMREIRPRGKKTGNPSFLVFTKVERVTDVTPEQHPESSPQEVKPSGNTWEDIYFRNEALKRNPSQVACQEAWNECIQLIGDPQQREAMAAVRVKTIENKRLILTGTKQQCANADNVLVTWGREKSLKFLSVVSEKAQILIESVGYYQMIDPVQTTIPFD